MQFVQHVIAQRNAQPFAVFPVIGEIYDFRRSMHAVGLGPRRRIREIRAADPDLVPLFGVYVLHSAHVVAKGQWFEADYANHVSFRFAEQDDFDRFRVRRPNTEPAAPTAQVTCAGPGEVRQCASDFRTSMERGGSVNETECSRP